jgi:glycosyltransferase involved in cell wall biosynthesis
MLKEVNLCAPFNQLGFGIFSVIYYYYLEQQGYRVNWQLIGNPNSPEIRTICDDYDLNYIAVQQAFLRKPNPECRTLTIWHAHQIDKCTIGSKLIGITHFETTKLLPEEIEKLKTLDEVYVCSEWGVEVLNNAGIVNAGLAPGIAASIMLDYTGDQSKMDHIKDTLDNLEQWTEPFLKTEAHPVTINSIGKWESRKDQAIFVQALEQISSLDKQGILVTAFWNNPFVDGLKEPIGYLSSRGWKLVHTLRDGDGRSGYVYTFKNITCALFPFLKSQKDLLRYLAFADIYVSTSKGEGWDQPLVDAMGMGKHCLATYNTAHTEYLNEDNCIIIPCRTELAQDGKWFHGNRGDWYPAIDLDTVVNRLEFIINMQRPHYMMQGHARVKIKNIHNCIPKFLEGIISDYESTTI